MDSRNDNTIKVKCDAAIFEGLNCYSFSFAARDHRREVVEARSKCRLGNLADILVETNCLVMVQAITSAAAPISYFGRLIQECKNLLADLKDRNVMVRFIKRSANTIAHFIAKSTYTMSDHSWRVSDYHAGSLMY